MTKRLFSFANISTRSTISRRVFLTTLVPLVILSILMFIYFVVVRINDADESIRTLGTTLTRQLAPAAQFGLFAKNQDDLERLGKSVTAEPDVSAAIFFDDSGKLLSFVGEPTSLQDPRNKATVWQGNSANNQILYFHEPVYLSKLKNLNAFEDEEPKSVLMGSVTLEVSLKRLQQQRTKILLLTLLTIGSILWITLLLARRLSRDVTEPLISIEQMVAKLSGGDLSSRIIPSKSTIFATLEQGINQMAAAIEQANQKNLRSLSTTRSELKSYTALSNAVLNAQSTAGIGMIVVQDGRIEFANDAAARLHGAAIEKLNQDSTLQTLLQRHTEIPRQEKLKTYEVTTSSVDGIRHLEVLILDFAKEEGDPIIRQLVLEIDVTERHENEENLRTAYEEMTRQKEAADRANTAKSRFLAAASHDLRQPMHALRLFAAELRRADDAAEIDMLAQKINLATGTMTELTESLMEVSREELGDLKPELVSFDLEPFLHGILLGQASSAASKNIELRLAPSSVWVLSDHHMLYRIISNLLSNAVRYTKQGKVLLGVRRLKNAIRIEIWDTGIGIAPEHLKNIFNEFFQIDNAERGEGKGIGLGLSIVEHFCRALDHQLGVRSWPGKGSMFSVMVPTVEQRESRLIPSVPSVLCLVNPGTFESLGELLVSWGYDVATMEDIAYDPSLEKVDIILFEEEQKITAVELIRGNPNAARLKLISLSDNPLTLQELSLQISHITLPIRPARLRALLNQLLPNQNL
jgi:signal transduction histidine kinase/uncharacterized membrane protein affecting hemolysin expression